MTQDSADSIAAQLAARNAEIAALEREIAMHRVSRLSGVPPEFISGATEEELLNSAQDALEWKTEGEAAISPSRPPTAAVPASIVTSATRIEGPKQITLGEFSRLSPQERMQAVRAGLLMNEGVAPPQPVKRTGH